VVGLLITLLLISVFTNSLIFAAEQKDPLSEFVKGVKEAIVLGGAQNNDHIELLPVSERFGQHQVKLELPLKGIPKEPFYELVLRYPVPEGLCLYSGENRLWAKEYRGSGSCEFGIDTTDSHRLFSMDSCIIGIDKKPRKLIYNLRIEGDTLTFSTAIPREAFEEPGNSLVMLLSPWTGGKSTRCNRGKYEKFSMSVSNSRTYSGTGRWNSPKKGTPKGVKKRLPPVQQNSIAYQGKPEIRGEEIVEKRTETSKTFKGEGQEYTAFLATEPIHYKSRSGKWEDIVTTISQTSDRKYPFANTTNGLKSFFGATPKDGVKIISGNSDRWIKWTNLGISYSSLGGRKKEILTPATVSAEADSNILRFRNIFPHCTEELIIRNNRIKHNLILSKEASTLISKNATKKDKLELINTLNWGFSLELENSLSLKTPNGIETESFASDNEIPVVDKDGNEYLFLQPPYAMDAKHNRVRCRYRVTRTTQGYNLFIEVPLLWLLDSERSFPVEIDPSITLYSNTSSLHRQLLRLYDSDQWGCTGCTDDYNDWPGTITYGSNDCCTDCSSRRSGVKVLTTAIPDGSEIRSISYTYYCDYTTYDWGVSDFYECSYEGISTSAATAWADWRDGTYYGHGPTEYAENWYTFTMPSSARTRMHNLLPSNWFTIGCSSYYCDEDGQDYGCADRGNSPYMVVTYIVGPDNYEDDDNCSEYTNIIPQTWESSQYHTISPEGDYDYFRFYAYCGRKYTFYTSYYDEHTDTYGYLGDDDCNIITSDDDGGDGLNFRIEWCCTETGYYKVWVRGYSSFTTGRYYFKYSYETPASCNQDAYESDDDCSNARAISPGSQDHTINMDGADVDWVTFTTTDYADFSVWTDGSSGDTRMWLYRGSCGSLTEVAYDDDGGTGLFSRIDATCVEPGTYYVKVDEYMENNPICSYTINLSDITYRTPDTPTLSAPADGIRHTGNSVTFQWSSCDRADGYKLWVNGSNVYTGSSTSYTMSTSDCTDYSWYVDAYNSCRTSTSSTRSFRENGEPTDPALSSPQMGHSLWQEARPSPGAHHPTATVTV